MAGSPISRRAVLSYGLGIGAATYAGVVAKQRAWPGRPGRSPVGGRGP